MADGPDRVDAAGLHATASGRTRSGTPGPAESIAGGLGNPPRAPAPKVRFQKLRPGAQAPRYMSAGAAGLDLASAADGPIALAPGGRAAVPTGLAFEIPPGFEGQVRPRSGLARKFGIGLPNAPGTIDSDYRGEVMVLLVNLGSEPYLVQPGERVAQLVIAPVVIAELEEVTELSGTVRGEGGFGHTG